RWTVSLWRKFRPWLPWIGAIVMVLAAVGASNWQKDPIGELTELGWKPEKTPTGYSLTFAGGPPPKGSIRALRQLHVGFAITLSEIVGTVSEWHELTNLARLRVYKLSNQREKLEPLTNLTSLTSLDLANTTTNTSNLEPLKGLTNLNELSLDHTNVSSVESL